MELPGLAGDSLADDARVFIDEDAHGPSSLSKAIDISRKSCRLQITDEVDEAEADHGFHLPERVILVKGPVVRIFGGDPLGLYAVEVGVKSEFGSVVVLFAIVL